MDHPSDNLRLRMGRHFWGTLLPVAVKKQFNKQASSNLGLAASNAQFIGQRYRRDPTAVVSRSTDSDYNFFKIGCTLEGSCPCLASKAKCTSISQLLLLSNRQMRHLTDGHLHMAFDSTMNWAFFFGIGSSYSTISLDDSQLGHITPSTWTNWGCLCLFQDSLEWSDLQCASLLLWNQAAESHSKKTAGS